MSVERNRVVWEGQTNSLLDSEPRSKVCVIGGAGRVGFGLSLVLANRNHFVWTIDKNTEANQLIANGSVPFREEKAQEFLEEALSRRRLAVTTELSVVSEADTIVVVLGTPIDEHFNPVLNPIFELFANLVPFLRPGQLIILRSTVAPGTTELLNSRLEKLTGWRSEEEFFLVFAPERVSEGHAIDEIASLPQLIGAFGERGYQRAESFFQTFIEAPCRSLTPKEAEIGKLITNMARYVEFALANELYLICDSFGVNTHNVFDACNYRYPRLKLPSPGPNVGGPCLYKDGFFLLERFPFTELIAQAFKINEGMTMQIVQKLQTYKGIRKVAILGMAFKADIDDTRNSLSFRLKKQLENNGYELALFDPLVECYADSSSIAQSDCVILMTPHSAFRDIHKIKRLVGKEQCLVVDTWGFWQEMRGKSRNGFFYFGELA